MAANDLTDIRPDGGANNPNISPTTLPIRGEKRIITTPVNPSTLSAEAQQFLGGKPRVFKVGRTALVQASDYSVTAALQPFVDYVLIRIPHRAISTSGQASNNPAVYRFLINPSTVQVNRNTLDGQALTRGGWQIGIWGEDSLQISLSGKTAGQYFAFGIADIWQPYTESFRNLQQLQVVFENNGYWFEGEQTGEGPMAADFTRRRIKMHADVELIVGNFIWQGMFDALEITQNADQPWLMEFNLTFIAWKERFRKSSPYTDTIHNDKQRGHAYDAWQATSTAAQNGVMSAALQNFPLAPSTSTPIPVLQQPGTSIIPAPGAANSPVSGAQQAATQSYSQSSVNGTIQSQDPTGLLLNPVGWSTFINGGR